ncbi:MAG: hypothetical protein JJT89_05660 [Nitriliruptoraceae bacterium]|nr:hypothetical protein [Nitriliruptoraceae bacterium]
MPAARERSDTRSGVRVSGIRMSILRPTALTLLALLIVVGATGWSISRSQTELRTANLERFDGRALVTASFLSAYLAGTVDDLGSPEFPIDDDALQPWLQASDLDAVRILDDAGAVIASSTGVPVGTPSPPPDGRWVTTEMSGLGSALTVAVTAEDGTTRQGWIGLNSSALIDLMNDAPATGRTVRLLVSPDGEVVLAQGGDRLDPSSLAGIVSGTPPATGMETVDVDGQRWVLFGHQGPSAGWVSFLAIRESELFVGAAGWTGAASWAVWGLLLVSGLVGVGLVHRLEGQSSRLARLNGDLWQRQRVLGASTEIVECTNRSQSMAEALPDLERGLSGLLGVTDVRWQPKRDRLASSEVVPTGGGHVEVPVEVHGAGGGALVLVGTPENSAGDDLEAIARVLASS